MPQDTANANTAAPKATLLSHIASFVRDVATLDVVTLTGDLKLVDPGTVYDNTKNDFDWDAFFRKETSDAGLDSPTDSSAAGHD